MSDQRRASRRVAIAIIVALLLLPALGIVSLAIWGDERDTPTERPEGSGGGLGG